MRVGGCNTCKATECSSGCLVQCCFPLKTRAKIWKGNSSHSIIYWLGAIQSTPFRCLKARAMRLSKLEEVPVTWTRDRFKIRQGTLIRTRRAHIDRMIAKLILSYTQGLASITSWTGILEGRKQSIISASYHPISNPMQIEEGPTISSLSLLIASPRSSRHKVIYFSIPFLDLLFLTASSTNRSSAPYEPKFPLFFPSPLSPIQRIESQCTASKGMYEVKISVANQTQN